jgi:hypothetical protein
MLDAIYPGSAVGKEDYSGILKQALERTVNIVADFGKIVETAAIAGDGDAIKEIFVGFKPILDRYYFTLDFPGGQYSDWDFDFYKFMGDELLVTMIAILIREQKWSIIKDLLDEHIVIENLKGGKPGNVGFEYFGKHFIYAFGARDHATGNAPRTELLAERHSSLPINAVVPFEDYMEADYFLFLRDRSTGNPGDEWTPWSTARLKRTPKFLIQAERKKYAEEIADALGGRTTFELAHIIKTTSSALKDFWGGFWDFPVDNQLIEKIAAFNQAKIIN